MISIVDGLGGRQPTRPFDGDWHGVLARVAAPGKPFR
jgi:hypothetical protein